MVVLSASSFKGEGGGVEGISKQVLRLEDPSIRYI